MLEIMRQCCENYFRRQQVKSYPFSGGDLKQRGNELRPPLRLTSC